MPSNRYNLVVIGAGTAGLVTAAGAAGLGARVALIERNLMGGDCLNFGCVPSKALISSARLIQKIREGRRWGLENFEPPFSFDAVFQRMRTVRAELAPHDSQERFESLGVEVFRGEAEFLAPDRVSVNGASLQSRHVVIATGGRAALPDLPGLKEAPVFTNETIFDRLERKPRSLLVLGGGPVGCELAQVFARLGVEVMIAQRAARLLPREDPDASEIILRKLRSEGVRVLLNARMNRLETAGGGTRAFFEPSPKEAGGAAESPATFDAVLIAAGRQPNVEGLNLAAAGVVCDPGGIRVNRYLQTTQPRVFAAGDVAGPHRFTHTADAQARVIVRNTLLPWKALWQKTDYSAVPWCNYTSPEVARVGLNETEAQRLGAAYDLHKLTMKEVDRAVLEGEEEGFAKVLTRRGSDRILGATLVCENAGDLLPEIVLAMKRGVGLGALAAVIHAYPTRAELVRKLADRYNRTRLTPRARKIFAWLYSRQTGGEAR